MTNEQIEVSYCERYFWPKCKSLVAQLKMAVKILMQVVVVAVVVVGRIKKEQNFIKGKKCLEN